MISFFLPDADLLIATTAISRDIPLKTGNQHFQRLREFGLRLEDSQTRLPSNARSMFVFQIWEYCECPISKNGK